MLPALGSVHEDVQVNQRMPTHSQLDDDIVGCVRLEYASSVDEPKRIRYQGEGCESNNRQLIGKGMEL
jgi:hypothetical protein